MHHLRLTSKQVLHVKRIRPPLFVTIIFAFLTVPFLPIHTNAQPRKPYVAGLSVGLGYSLSPGYSSFLRDAYPDVEFILTGMTPLDLSMPLSLIDLFKGKKVNLYIIPRARFYLGRVDIFTKGFGSTERGITNTMLGGAVRMSFQTSTTNVYLEAGMYNSSISSTLSRLTNLSSSNAMNFGFGVWAQDGTAQFEIGYALATVNREEIAKEFGGLYLMLSRGFKLQ